eukprot:171261-Pyramimonas_sp.AAC.3
MCPHDSSRPYSSFFLYPMVTAQHSLSACVTCITPVTPSPGAAGLPGGATGPSRHSLRVSLS